MELWIARDKDGELGLYIKEPIRLKEQEYFIGHSGRRYCIDDDLFPQVTWENSPQRVRIEIIEEL